MKKTNLILAGVLIAFAALIFSGCGSTPKAEENTEYAKYYSDDYWYRNYTFEAYNEGFYKPNYVQIPGVQETENEDALAYFGKANRVDRFNLDGTDIYIGWKDNYLVAMQNKSTPIMNKTSLDKDEINIFKFTNGDGYNLGLGIEKEIEINGKKYVCAFAGVNTDSFGFRLWVKDGANVETAKCKPAGEYNQMNYDTAAYNAGVYKAGWTQVWGVRANRSGFEKDRQVWKYEYNGENIYIGVLPDRTLGVITEDGSVVATSTKYFKYKCMGDDGKKYNGMGVGWEATGKLNGEKIVIAVGVLDDTVRLWVKDAE